MVSVTQRINEIKQPRGGYLNPKDFTVSEIVDNLTLHERESITPAMMGTVVDYLIRYSMSLDASSAFKIAIDGAYILGKDEVIKMLMLLHIIIEDNGEFSDDMIIAACKMMVFDSVFRAGPQVYRDPSGVVVDSDTIENIRIMIGRGRDFYSGDNIIVVDGFTFYPSGYTSVVNVGDGDFLTNDTLWDCKVIKGEPTSKHTLQLLMYYIMGKHSKSPIFDNIKHIGIFNPRKNKVYKYSIKDIDREIIKTIEDDVICYE